MTPEKDYVFYLPEDFDQELWETKGCYLNARFEISGKQYALDFYDPSRLAQQVADEINRCGVFLEKNLLVVDAVTRDNLEAAVKNLISENRLDALFPKGGQ